MSDHREGEGPPEQPLWMSTRTWPMSGPACPTVGRAKVLLSRRCATNDPKPSKWATNGVGVFRPNGANLPKSLSECSPLPIAGEGQGGEGIGVFGQALGGRAQWRLLHLPSSILDLPADNVKASLAFPPSSGV